MNNKISFIYFLSIDYSASGHTRIPIHSYIYIHALMCSGAALMDDKNAESISEMRNIHVIKCFRVKCIEFIYEGMIVHI